MAEHKFRAFLNSRKWEDNLRHFTAQAEDDANLPDPTSWEELERYLKAIPTTSERALSAAKYVWGLYAAGAMQRTL